MINIRKASQNDAKDYATILNQGWKDTYKEYISSEIIDKELNVERLIKEFPSYINDDSFELYMIEYNNEVVGILELGSPDPDDIYKDNIDGFGEFRTCYIKKDYQNLGIGTKCFEFVKKRLKELGYNKCFLWVKKQNKKAIEFHKKNGFVQTKYTCENPSDGAPSFVMEGDLI